MKYTGLKIEDKAALLEAKAKGMKYCELLERDIKFTLNHPIRYDGDICNIDEALAQIAEMESEAEKPLTWNDWLNQASVKEKAAWMLKVGVKMHNEAGCYAWEDDELGIPCDRYVERMAEILDRPCYLTEADHVQED